MDANDTTDEGLRRLRNIVKTLSDYRSFSEAELAEALDMLGIALDAKRSIEALLTRGYLRIKDGRYVPTRRGQTWMRSALN